MLAQRTEIHMKRTHYSPTGLGLRTHVIVQHSCGGEEVAYSQLIPQPVRRVIVAIGLNSIISGREIRIRRQTRPRGEPRGYENHMVVYDWLTA